MENVISQTADGVSHAPGRRGLGLQGLSGSAALSANADPNQIRIQDLAMELLHQIARELKFLELIRFAGVCKLFQEVADELCRQEIVKRYPELASQFPAIADELRSQQVVKKSPELVDQKLTERSLPFLIKRLLVEKGLSNATARFNWRSICTLYEKVTHHAVCNKDGISTVITWKRGLSVQHSKCQMIKGCSDSNSSPIPQVVKLYTRFSNGARLTSGINTWFEKGTPYCELDGKLGLVTAESEKKPRLKTILGTRLVVRLLDDLSAVRCEVFIKDLRSVQWIGARRQYVLALGDTRTTVGRQTEEKRCLYLWNLATKTCKLWHQCPKKQAGVVQRGVWSPEADTTNPLFAVAENFVGFSLLQIFNPVRESRVFVEGIPSNVTGIAFVPGGLIVSRDTTPLSSQGCASSYITRNEFDTDQKTKLLKWSAVAHSCTNLKEVPYLDVIRMGSVYWGLPRTGGQSRLWTWKGGKVSSQELSVIDGELEEKWHGKSTFKWAWRNGRPTIICLTRWEHRVHETRTDHLFRCYVADFLPTKMHKPEGNAIVVKDHPPSKRPAEEALQRQERKRQRTTAMTDQSGGTQPASNITVTVSHKDARLIAKQLQTLSKQGHLDNTSPLGRLSQRFKTQLVPHSRGNVTPISMRRGHAAGNKERAESNGAAPSVNGSRSQGAGKGKAPKDQVR